MLTCSRLLLPPAPAPSSPGLLFSLLMTTASRRRLVSSMLPDRVVEALARGREYVEDFKNVTIMFADIAQVSHGCRYCTGESWLQILHR